MLPSDCEHLWLIGLYNHMPIAGLSRERAQQQVNVTCALSAQTNPRVWFGLAGPSCGVGL
jgi:hypothetical protein